MLFKYTSSLVNGFIKHQEKIVVSDLGNLIIYSCHYDITLFHVGLFEQYGILYPECIKNAVDKRQSDYLAGRYSAKLALRKLGITAFDILSDNHKSPVWPKGIHGSISHTMNKAYVAVGYCTHFNYIGIDYEQIVTSKTAENIKYMILSEVEYNLLSNYNLEFRTMLTIVFSAKESLFKALFPSVGVYFNFFAVEVINISIETSSFELRLKQPLTEQLITGTRFKGWFKLESTNVLTVIGC